jgi:hypothetical protein
MVAPNALWSAAACCRFCIASSLAPSIRRTASKLAGKKAAASCRTPKRFAHFHGRLAQGQPSPATHVEKKHSEKLDYRHHNPVRRRLVTSPD